MTEDGVRDKWGRKHEQELCSECGNKIRTPPKNIYIDGICTKCASEEYGYYEADISDVDGLGDEEY